MRSDLLVERGSVPPEEQRDPSREPIARRRNGRPERPRRTRRRLHCDQALAWSHEAELARLVDNVRVRLALRDVALQLRAPRLLRVDARLHRPRLARYGRLLHRHTDERAPQYEARREHTGGNERTHVARERPADTRA